MELLQTLLVAAIVLVCGGLVVKRTLAKAGIGQPDGKPDCGCGHCAEKNDSKR